jgi:DNA-binding CsgD family transcriptional regulator
VLGRDDANARDQLRLAPAALRRGNRGALCYADAVAAGRVGRRSDAESHFDEGDRLLATAHWWRRLLHLVVCPAAIKDGWGDPVATLRGDLTAFEAADDDRLARTCRDQLRRAGVRVRRGRGAADVPTRLRALGVTSREMDVVLLIAERLSNLEIADRLYLSPRTVETHVSNLLTKTGTTSRTELVSFVVRESGEHGQ